MSIDFIKFSNDFKKTYGNKLSLISTSEDYLNLNSEVTVICAKYSLMNRIKDM